MNFLRFQRTFARLLSKKGVPKNFPPNTPLYFGEVFEIPKDFLQKVLCVRVWGGQPQLITLSQKKHGIAVLFILSKCVGTAFQTLLQEAFEKAPRKSAKLSPDYIILFLRKLLKFQETFHEKFLVSGSRGGQPRFFYFSPGLSSSSFFRLPHEEQSPEHPEQPPRRLYLTVDITASTKRSATIPITI